MKVVFPHYSALNFKLLTLYPKSCHFGGFSARVSLGT